MTGHKRNLSRLRFAQHEIDDWLILPGDSTSGRVSRFNYPNGRAPLDAQLVHPFMDFVTTQTPAANREA